MSLMMARRRAKAEKTAKKPEWLKKREEAAAIRAKARKNSLDSMIDAEKARKEYMEKEGKIMKEARAASQKEIAANMKAMREKKPKTPEEMSKEKEALKEKRDAELKASRAKLAKAAAKNASDSKQKSNPKPDPEPENSDSEGEENNGADEQGATEDS